MASIWFSPTEFIAKHQAHDFEAGNFEADDSESSLPMVKGLVKLSESRDGILFSPDSRQWVSIHPALIDRYPSPGKTGS